jgi:hypothetical protein
MKKLLIISLCCVVAIAETGYLQGAARPEILIHAAAAAIRAGDLNILKEIVPARIPVSSTIGNGTLYDLALIERMFRPRDPRYASIVNYLENHAYYLDAQTIPIGRP